MTAPWGSTNDIARIRGKAFEVGEEVGCNNMVDSRQLVDCLRKVDAKDLTRAFMTVSKFHLNNELLGVHLVFKIILCLIFSMFSNIYFYFIIIHDEHTKS